MIITRAIPFTSCMYSGLVKAAGGGGGTLQKYSAVINHCRMFARESARHVKAVPRQQQARQSFKDKLFGPATNTPFKIGQLGLAAGSALGIGALCYYGLGLSNGVGAIDRAAIWPQYVRDRIRTTYGYVAASLAVTTGSAVAVYRTPALMKLSCRSGLVSFIVCLGMLIGTGVLCLETPYREGQLFGAKHMTWLLHTGVVGACIAPFALLGGPILLRAAWYTAGVVGGLSAIAVCAPSEKFLNIGGVLTMGLGVVLVSSLGAAFLPPTTMLAAGAYSMSIYGGLLLFSVFLLHDTQRVIKMSESFPAVQYAGDLSYDPINMALEIYMDTLLLFIRIAMLLQSPKGRSRR